jgi:hypothetical protein
LGPVRAGHDQTIMPDGNESLMLEHTQVCLQSLEQRFISLRIGTKDLDRGIFTWHSFTSSALHENGYAYSYCLI